MATYTSYKNIYGDLISTQQLETINDYRIDYNEDNSLKKSEFYKNKILYSVNYYLSKNESYTDFLNLYTQEVEVIFFQDIQTSGNFKEINVKKINQGLVQEESWLVENLINQDIIYTKVLNSKGSFIRLEKYFYEGEDLKYIFEYFENGNIYMINFFKNLDSEQLHYLSTECQNFDWTGIEYYQNGLKLFPN